MAEKSSGPHEARARCSSSSRGPPTLRLAGGKTRCPTEVDRLEDVVSLDFRIEHFAFSSPSCPSSAMSSASADVTAVVKEAIAQPPLRRPPVGPIIAAMRALEDSQDPRVQRLITAILPLIEEAAGAELAAQGQERARRVPLYPSDRVLLVESYVGARSAQAVAARHADPTKWGIPANHGSASSSATRNTTRKVKKVVYFLRFSSLWWSKSGKCSSERVFRPIVEKLLRRALTKEDKGIIDLDREEWDLVEELRVGSALARPLKAADGTTTLSLWQSALTSLQGAPVVVFFGRDCPVDNKDAMCTYRACEGRPRCARICQLTVLFYPQTGLSSTWTLVLSSSQRGAMMMAFGNGSDTSARCSSFNSAAAHSRVRQTPTQSPAR